MSEWFPVESPKYSVIPTCNLFFDIYYLEVFFKLLDTWVNAFVLIVSFLFLTEPHGSRDLRSATRD